MVVVIALRCCHLGGHCSNDLQQTNIIVFPNPVILSNAFHCYCHYSSVSYFFHKQWSICTAHCLVVYSGCVSMMSRWECYRKLWGLCTRVLVVPSGHRKDEDNQTRQAWRWHMWNKPVLAALKLTKPAPTVQVLKSTKHTAFKSAKPVLTAIKSNKPTALESTQPIPTALKSNKPASKALRSNNPAPTALSQPHLHPKTEFLKANGRFIFYFCEVWMRWIPDKKLQNFLLTPPPPQIFFIF